MNKKTINIIIGIVVLAVALIVIGLLTGGIGGGKHCVCNNHNCNCKVYDYNNKLIKSYSYKN
jgi:hypothetical protein